jgi:hypothetical protein
MNVRPPRLRSLDCRALSARNLALLIDRAPKPEQLPKDHSHLIEIAMLGAVVGAQVSGRAAGRSSRPIGERTIFYSLDYVFQRLGVYS